MQRLAPAGDAVRMDRHYKYQRFIYDSTRTHNLIGRKHLIRQLAPKPGQTVLEIGCGTAWNLAWTARSYPKAKLYGLDVSNAMLATARSSLKRKGLLERVTLGQGDATNFDARAVFGRNQFDRVFFSYALSMIPNWEMALDHACTFVAPGGELHIVDFGQCGGLPAGFKSALFAFLRHYDVTPRANMDAIVANVAAANGMTATVTRLHRGYTDYAVLKRT